MPQHQWTMGRRRFAQGLLAGAAVIGLGGCAATQGFSLTEIIRRLLSQSSQRAFASLMQPNGFFDSQVARISVPDRLGGSGATGVLTRLLVSAALKDRLTRQVNRAAEKGAERAAPVIAQAITSMPIGDAAAILNGADPGAATALLKQTMGDALITAMLPGIDEGLRLFDSDVVSQVLGKVSGISFDGLRDDVTRKASDAIYAAMAQEEAAIRANPQITNDPILIAALTAAR